MAEAGGLYYEWHGPEDAPPLILSAGMGGSGRYWLPNLPALAESFRVILYDHRGTGRSDRTVTPRIESIGDDIRLLMDALGIERASILGHAIGGMGGLSMALDTPERVDRLVVVNGWGRLDRYTARCFDARLALLRACGPGKYVDAQPIFLFPPEWISDNHARLEEEAVHHVAGFPADMVEARILAALRFDLIDRLAAAPPDMPVLLLASDDDALVPPGCSRALAQVIPRAQLVRMPWGGHACNVTDPPGFEARVLAFLGS
ncbi:pyrimidine utilization protein D [Sphingomonas sp. CBMAI 2297]|uniref:pyrimidine utilization protein D n=1 Tax=Sphingomonas sp. CBMAI 2297 TaxID=2991720 RepID=UPI002458793F|nr:pyrimidine utilization protein D [Sphingomonas sp. CBMAI 2297]MDH4746827.1 pyrimidine utilization protein D [Sphingomonas sp. CBMAI 2297]